MIEKYDFLHRNTKLKEILIIDNPENGPYVGEWLSYNIKIITDNTEIDIFGSNNGGPDIYVDGKEHYSPEIIK